MKEKNEKIDLDDQKMNKLLAIVGPTATGKTDLGLSLAKKYHGELVSCDSRQVYRGLDLMTGKIPDAKKIVKHQGYWEVDRTAIWMLDVCEIQRVYSVSDYIRDAKVVLTDIWSRGKLPIVVGGTGYYLRGLLEGFANVGVPVNEELRDEINGLEIAQLQARLARLSPARWERMTNSDRQNKVRLSRAIEVGEYRMMNGEIVDDPPLLCEKIDVLKIGLDTSIDELRQRIKVRLEKRIDQGMIDEADKLHRVGLSFDRMDQLGLECRYLAKYLNKAMDLETMKRRLEVKIGQYAKRQRTWFRADTSICWFEIGQNRWMAKVEKRVRDWYN